MERKKILVVDDEETICEALKFNLEQKGYDVDVAHSGEDVLVLSPENYSLILLDVMMEGVSGLQVARILRRNPKTERVPIIFCSARDTEDDVVEGLGTGADDYITKPYSLKTLLARANARQQAVFCRRRGGKDAEEGIRDIAYAALASRACVLTRGTA